MSLSLIEYEKPKLTVCKMSCDNGLHEKLNKYELTKFMNSHTTNIFCGRPRSGKTSAVYSLFKSSKLMKKTYHNIFIFQPSHSRESMVDNIFGSLPEDQLFEELNIENLDEVMSVIKNASKEENHCIVFDDMTAYLKNKETLQLLKELIFNRRHLHVSIYFLVQTWYSVPKELRKLFNNIFLFKVNKNEMETVFEECIEQKKELIPALSKFVFDKPYQFLFINVESQRMFKNWDEIIIS